jgi:hypothetical protein
MKKNNCATCFRISLTASLLFIAIPFFAQNVGIGDSNPLQKLHINNDGAGLQTIRIEDLATGADGDFGATSGSNIQTNTTNNKVVYVDDNGDMTARYAYGDNIQQVVLPSGTQNISTTTLTDITGATITFTPRHSTVYLSFAISGYNPLSSGLQSSFFVVNVDVGGSSLGNFLSLSAERDAGSSTGAATVGANNFPITGLTPGTPVTIKLRGRRGGSAATSGFLIDRTGYTSYMTIWD